MAKDEPARGATSTSRRDGRRGPLGRMVDRITSTSQELDARELLEESRDRGATPVRQCKVGDRVVVSGTVRAVTLRPVGGVPALEAELYDGSAAIRLVWLGRRRIHGIDPGRTMTVTGRVTHQGGSRVIFNPSYELHA
jgi:hypothetical protein